MGKKVQVDFSDDVIASLDEIAGQLRRKRNNYKLGVATVIAEIVEHVLNTRPELLREFFDGEAETQEVLPRPKSARQR